MTRDFKGRAQPKAKGRPQRSGIFWFAAGALLGAFVVGLLWLRLDPALWRSGSGGAFRMGVEHGAYCVGCCWFLMGLLFFGGVMNLFWIGGIAVFVLLEKTIPVGHWLGHAVGIALIAWGGIIFLGAI